EFKALLEGYAQGLNDYAAKHPGDVLVRDAFPVTTLDHVTTQVLSLAVISGVDQVLSNLFAGKVRTALPATGGSNAIAIHSSRTTDGKTYLAINSHQPLEGPVAWYEAHLASEEGWNILGGLFPGSPVINHGCNPYLGWAHTINYQDKIDVYQLETNPANPKQYRFDGQWLDLEEKDVKLKVKVGAGIRIGVKRKAYWSRYGATVRTEKGTFAVSLAANRDIRGVEQWYRMNKARTFSEFRRALQMLAIPGFNIVYADRYDTIYYVSNGKLPRRNPAYDWAGTLPGNTSQTVWREFHPFGDLPQLINPASGYLFNTNHTPFNATAPADNLHARDFDPTMGYETKDNNRSRRFTELITRAGKLSYDDFKGIKYDLQLPARLAYPTDITAVFDLGPDEYPDLQTTLAKLKRWNRRGDADNRDALVFLLAYTRVTDQVEAAGGSSYVNRKIDKEVCVAALRYARDYLIRHFGTLEVALGDYQKLVRGDTELPVAGLPDVMAAMATGPYRGGRVRANQGESYIQLVRFSKDGSEIETISPYGASNHPDSPHYADQMELFVQQRTKKMTLDKAQVLKEAERVYHPNGLRDEKSKQ
ncbi:MAG: penicillin acylase family protein, partial [Ferruginibacter sp.]|nr:penicillin acylase family protein [Cytophagales bacterium]